MKTEVMRTINNFFRIDCSTYGDWLLSLPIGDISGDDVSKLSEMMNVLDPFHNTKGTWCVEELCKARVIYSGVNGTQMPTHPLYEKVVGVQLCNRTRVYFNLGKKS